MTRPQLRRIAPLLLLLAALALAGRAVRAQGDVDRSDERRVPDAYTVAVGGPDRFGYDYTDERDPACTFDWYDPANAAPFTAGVSLALPFDFPFYGERYRALTIEPHGVLRLGGDPLGRENAPSVAGGTPHIALYWDDLDSESLAVSRAGEALVVTLAASRDGDALRAQALLFPDGRVRLQYAETPAGERASVGIAGRDAGLGYLFNGAPGANRLTPGRAICFTPPAPELYLSPGRQIASAPAGRGATHRVTLLNRTPERLELDLTVEGAWAAAVEANDHVTLDPGGSAEVVLTVWVPADAMGNTGTTVLHARSRDGRYATRALLETLGTSGMFGYTGAQTTDDLKAWDLATGLPVPGTLDLLPDGNYPYDATIHPDGDELWVVGAIGDGAIIVDTSTNAERRRIPGVGNYPVDVAFSKDGATAYIANRDDDAIAVVDTASYTVTDAITLTIGIPVDAGKLAVNQCTGELYAVDWFDDNFMVIDPVSRSVASHFDAGQSLWDLVLSPDATTIYVTDRGLDEVHVIDAAAPTAVVTSIPTGDDPWGIDVTPDGALLFVANEDSNDITVIDTAALTVTATIPLAPDADPRDVDVSSDGTTVYVPSGDLLGTGTDVIYTIDVATLALGSPISTQTAANPNAIAVAPEHLSLDPTAAFTATTTVPLGTPVQFTDTSPGTPTSWQWDFGDGVGSSTQQNPLYNYANPGTYTVTLTVANRCGSDSTRRMITVAPAPSGAVLRLPILIR